MDERIAGLVNAEKRAGAVLAFGSATEFMKLFSGPDLEKGIGIQCWNH